MRFFTLFTALALVVLGVASKPLNIDIDLPSFLDADLAESNAYGAPLAPWRSGSRPGWYYGKYPERHPSLRCLRGVCALMFRTAEDAQNTIQWICKLLMWFPHVMQCPKPPHVPPKPPTSDGYTQTFANLTGATQAGDYLTYGLVDTIVGKIHNFYCVY